jgi:dihydrofolate reductase
MRAIAAMAQNRVIGLGGAIPWHIPAEFRWFRDKTINCPIIMGRRTFEGLPKPLPGRVNIVLTRHPERLRKSERPPFRDAMTGAAAHRRVQDIHQLSLPSSPLTQVRLARGMDPLRRAGITRHAWLCGGAEVYRQFLPDCSELWLSVIHRDAEGDACFPPFEHLFDLTGMVAENADFHVLRYVRNRVPAFAGVGANASTGRPGPAERHAVSNAE